MENTIIIPAPSLAEEQTSLQLPDALPLPPSPTTSEIDLGGQESGPTSSNSSETESEAIPITTQASKQERRASGRSRKEPRRFEDQFGYTPDELIETKNKKKHDHGSRSRSRRSSITAASSSAASVYDFEEKDSFEELENLLGKRKIDVSQATESQVRQLREMLYELQDIKREIAFLKNEPARRPPPPPRPVRSITATTGGVVPPAKRPKKRSHKKKMRDEEKQKLYTDICGLPADKLCEVLNFVKQICPDAIKYSAPDEAEIEINEIDNDNLWRLDRLCKRLALLPTVKK